MFTSLDDNGSLYMQGVTPTTVAADGSSLTVVVPTNATTGTVRLARENFGLLLQVVPTLTHVDVNINGVFNGGGASITGSGFAEGQTTLNFGAGKLVDAARDSSGMDVYGSGHSMNFTVPSGVGSGPLSVTTLGGTSAIYPLSFTGITASPLSGTAANAGLPAANQGQLITLAGTGLDATTDIVFTTVDDSGNKGQIVVHPIAVSADGTSATAVVPGNATTGIVRIVGDLNGNAVTLQILPTITGMTVNSVASDGSSASITLRGTGFVDGNNTFWQFGSVAVLDASSLNQGPDVYNGGTFVNLTVPLNGAFGPITVTTAGGTSAALSTPLTGVIGVAMGGTPANAALPSANAGQAVILTGTGLTTATGMIFSYTPSGGSTTSYVLLAPSAAAANGTSATFIVPAYANGVATLSVLGSSSAQTLQIVPTLSSYFVDGTNALRLFGSGLQEGSATNPVIYNFAGGSVTDTAGNSGPDVYSSSGDNTGVYLPTEAVHGFGTVTTTTAGGTSAPLTMNELQTGDGLVRAIAMDTAHPTQLWVADNANPAQLHLIDTTTGAQIRAIPITNVSSATNSVGNTTFFGGMQVAPSALTLRGTPIPAGSLLMFYGPSNPDYVVAINPTSGNAIGNLPLLANYDTTSGVFDPVTGDLFLVDRNSPGGNRIVAIFPSNAGGHTAGQEDPAHTFAAPFNTGDSGLALDPSGDGTLWFGSDQTGDIVQMTNTGTVLRHLTVATQGPGNIGVSGIAFDASGNLLVSTNQGVVLKLNVNFDAAHADAHADTDRDQCDRNGRHSGYGRAIG